MTFLQIPLGQEVMVIAEARTVLNTWGLMTIDKDFSVTVVTNPYDIYNLLVLGGNNLVLLSANQSSLSPQAHGKSVLTLRL